jgi:DNA-binding winged helix-turn-helix (wHTH) protein
MSRTNQPVYAFGPFRLIPAERVLRRDGEIIPLTPKALETLLALVEHCGRVVTKEELMRRVWPDTFVEEANVAKNVYALRRALGEVDGAQEYIETVPKRGYQFVAPVARLESPGEAVAAVGPRLESVGPHTESVGPRPKEVVAPPAESVSAAGGREAPRRFIAVAASILLLSVAALLAYRYAPQTSPAVPEQAPRIAPFANSPDIEEYPSFSPDGSQVVYSRSAVDGPPGRASLYVQSVAGGAGPETFFLRVAACATIGHRNRFLNTCW